MATETTARVQTQQRDTPGEDEYQAFCAALSASGRGRAFLTEYARRSRATTTAPLLTAIERLHSSLAPDAATPAEALIRQKLRVLLDDIAAAHGELEAELQALKSAKLAELLGIVEQRLAELMAPSRSESAPAERPPPAAPQAPAAEHVRSHLVVVPAAEQPELPIPVPAAAPSPAITLVHTTPDVAPEARSDPAPVAVEQPQQPAGAQSPPTPPVAEPQRNTEAVAAGPVTRELDPLAAIKALTEDERLALFT